MSQFFKVHPENPQARLIQQAANIVQSGGVIVYPTDSSYALGCRLGDKDAMEKMVRLRQLDKNHHFTLVCRDLSEIATYAKVSNQAFRLMKTLTPGAFTFILPATHEVPRRLQHPKRKTIGLRIPQHPIVDALLNQLNEPLLSTTLLLPEREIPETDADEIREQLERQVDLIIDGGNCSVELTTVLDLTDEMPKLIRQGKGDITGITVIEE